MPFKILHFLLKFDYCHVFEGDASKAIKKQKGVQFMEPIKGALHL